MTLPINAAWQRYVKDHPRIPRWRLNETQREAFDAGWNAEKDFQRDVRTPAAGTTFRAFSSIAFTFALLPALLWAMSWLYWGNPKASTPLELWWTVPLAVAFGWISFRLWRKADRLDQKQIAWLTEKWTVDA